MHTPDLNATLEALPEIPEFRFKKRVLQVMKLALSQRKKALTFLSTVGVVAGLDHPEAVLETEDGPSLCSEHPGDGGYAVGWVFPQFPSSFSA